jgi:hypothetical protein
MKLLRTILKSVLITSLAFLITMPQLFALDVNKTTLTRAINAQFSDASRESLILASSNYTLLTWNNYLTTILDAQNGEDSETITQPEIDTLVANIYSGSGHQLFHLILIFAAKGTLQIKLFTGHISTPFAKFAWLNAFNQQIKAKTET